MNPALTATANITANAIIEQKQLRISSIRWAMGSKLLYEWAGQRIDKNLLYGRQDTKIAAVRLGERLNRQQTTCAA